VESAALGMAIFTMVITAIAVTFRYCIKAVIKGLCGTRLEVEASHCVLRLGMHIVDARNRPLGLLIFLFIVLLPQTTFSRSLEEIKKSGFIRIGTADIDFKPIHYRDRENNHTGIDIDLINVIARKIGVNLDLVLFKGAEKRLELLKNEEVDLIISNFSITPTRLEEIDFSIPYLTTGVGLILHNRLKTIIKEYDDLNKNKIKIAIIPYSTQFKAFQASYPNAELAVYNTSTEAFNPRSRGLTVPAIFFAWGNCIPRGIEAQCATDEQVMGLDPIDLLALLLA
jgi:ABC-type amino acid transport substrate-binding protein